jgi:Domain of unknown function (DUF4406)
LRIVYLAGRYNGNTLAEVAHNIDEARKVALELAKRRIPFLCTILQTAHFDSLLSERDPGYGYWIQCSLEVVKRCDAIFLIPSWQQSNGARKEVESARAHGLPVFQDIEMLTDWVSRRAL